LKQNWWLSVKWGLSVLLGYALSGGAWWLFSTIQQDWATYASAAAGALIFLWTAINQFSFPMLLVQQEPKVWIAIRNGYVLVVRRPLDALKTLLLTALIAAVSTLLAPAWVVFSMALIAHLQTRALLAAVAKVRSQDAERDTADSYRQSSVTEELSDLEKRETEK
jgi:uncharacterized membrane protein YesL